MSSWEESDRDDHCHLNSGSRLCLVRAPPALGLGLPGPMSSGVWIPDLNQMHVVCCSNSYRQKVQRHLRNEE